ncbi:MAG: LamG-like jellyroll fold domain-containing protein [Kofleriaceae bacterium]
MRFDRFLLLVLLTGCGDDSTTTVIDSALSDTQASVDAAPCTSACGSIQFFGRGHTFGDRVRWRLDDPATTTPGPTLDVGAGDFTLEWWMRGTAAANPNSIMCGNGIGWTSSNIILDRDRHSQSPAFGAGVHSASLVWAVVGAAGDSTSMCGDTIVADGQWHHVAVDRRRSDGRMRIFVDGVLDASADGPDGDVSYPDNGQPTSLCPMGLCDYSDPFLVLGAEKHGYPDISFAGFIDELRVSRVLRYDATFTPRTTPFDPDADTVGLYHFDGSATDATGALDGEVVLGGGGPTWSGETAF